MIFLCIIPLHPINGPIKITNFKCEYCLDHLSENFTIFWITDDSMSIDKHTPGFKCHDSSKIFLNKCAVGGFQCYSIWDKVCTFSSVFWNDNNYLELNFSAFK